MTKRLRLRFSGIVQGVGFRPFVYRLAVAHGLGGFVQNRLDGVFVEIEGNDKAIEAFVYRTAAELPPLAQISEIYTEDAEPIGESSFRIIPSEDEGRPDVLVSPDAATCRECLQELFDPDDRRFRYPFINCSNCGPRLTIVTNTPFERKNTSMADFTLCEKCRQEHQDPLSRRFHAEPNACPECGPEIWLADAKGSRLDCADPLRKTIELLKEGKAVAVKGLGGFHLCADAANSEALGRLRKRKFREEKPFAIMMRDIERARAVAELTSDEEKLLGSAERPIVLVKKKAESTLSPFVAPGMADLGVMLPYTPVQHLLLREDFEALVMTSANQTGEPVCTSNSEALRRLKGIADYFLFHNRNIAVRCDDSVTMFAQGAQRVLRRSRGYVPKPLVLARQYPSVLGLGAHLKTAVCILKGDFAFLSQYVGNMDTPETREFFHESIANLRRVTGCDPDIVACDMHPDYYTTWVSTQMERRVVQVQHHHAHIASCMAENRITGDVIGLAMDWTGYGLDRRIWGGEFLVADEADFQRAGHIRYFPLPGGDASVKQPWRIAAALLMECFEDDWKKMAEKLKILPEDIPYESVEAVVRQKVQTVFTSSLGRVFDAVSCILGVRRQVSFEGQAAMELEACAGGSSSSKVLPYDILMDREIILDFYPAIRRLAEERVRGMSVRDLSGAFHATLIQSFAKVAQEIRDATGLNRVVLSGGCFQNRLLLSGCVAELDLKGFDVYTHYLVPPNDSGLSLGQVLVAGTVAG